MKARKIVRNRRKMNEKGVSPVIGVILMVAATIVIAAVVMGMLGSFKAPTSKTYSVSASATENSTHCIVLTFEGGPDANLVDYLNVSINGTHVGQIGNADGHSTDVEIGDQEAYPVTSGVADRVLVTAIFVDGSKQIVLDTYV